jgi:hypothetical protein
VGVYLLWSCLWEDKTLILIVQDSVILEERISCSPGKHHGVEKSEWDKKRMLRVIWKALFVEHRARFWLEADLKRPKSDVQKYNQ